jgi:hypothetical protein
LGGSHCRNEFRDSNSVFRIAGAEVFSAERLLRFDSATGRWYGVWYKDSLLDAGPWRPLTNNWPGSGVPMQFNDSADVSQRFYRISVKLAPE